MAEPDRRNRKTQQDTEFVSYCCNPSAKQKRHSCKFVVYKNGYTARVCIESVFRQQLVVGAGASGCHWLVLVLVLGADVMLAPAARAQHAPQAQAQAPAAPVLALAPAPAAPAPTSRQLHLAWPAACS